MSVAPQQPVRRWGREFSRDGRERSDRVGKVLGEPAPEGLVRRRVAAMMERQERVHIQR